MRTNEFGGYRVILEDGEREMNYPAASNGVSKSFTKKVNAPRGGEYNPERFKDEEDFRKYLGLLLRS